MKKYSVEVVYSVRQQVEVEAKNAVDAAEAAEYEVFMNEDGCLSGSAQVINMQVYDGVQEDWVDCEI